MTKESAYFYAMTRNGGGVYGERLFLRSADEVKAAIDTAIEERRQHARRIGKSLTFNPMWIVEKKTVTTYAENGDFLFRSTLETTTGEQYPAKTLYL